MLLFKVKYLESFAEDRRNGWISEGTEIEVTSAPINEYQEILGNFMDNYTFKTTRQQPCPC